MRISTGVLRNRRITRVRRVMCEDLKRRVMCESQACAVPLAYARLLLQALQAQAVCLLAWQLLGR